MAKPFGLRLLRNQKGQSVVEYILLLSVISSLVFAFYNNKRFKDLIRGNDGMFATMKKGMAYSYRYGVEYSASIPYEEKMGYEYESNKHDAYLNSTNGESRFFAGDEPYPKNQ